MRNPNAVDCKNDVASFASKLKQRRWDKKRRKMSKNQIFNGNSTTPTRNMPVFMLSTSMIHIFSMHTHTHTPPTGHASPSRLLLDLH